MNRKIMAMLIAIFTAFSGQLAHAQPAPVPTRLPDPATIPASQRLAQDTNGEFIPLGRWMGLYIGMLTLCEVRPNGRVTLSNGTSFVAAQTCVNQLGGGREEIVAIAVVPPQTSANHEHFDGWYATREIYDAFRQGFLLDRWPRNANHRNGGWATPPLRRAGS